MIRFNPAKQISSAAQSVILRDLKAHGVAEVTMLDMIRAFRSPWQHDQFCAVHGLKHEFERVKQVHRFTKQ